VVSQDPVTQDPAVEDLVTQDPLALWTSSAFIEDAAPGLRSSWHGEASALPASGSSRMPEFGQARSGLRRPRVGSGSR
jgi:hypothetical protein